MRHIVVVACSTLAISAGFLTASAVPALADQVDREVCVTADVRSAHHDPTPNGPVRKCVDEMIANECAGTTMGADPALVVTTEVCFPLPHALP